MEAGSIRCCALSGDLVPVMTSGNGMSVFVVFWEAKWVVDGVGAALKRLMAFAPRRCRGVIVFFGAEEILDFGGPVVGLMASGMRDERVVWVEVATVGRVLTAAGVGVKENLLAKSGIIMEVGVSTGVWRVSGWPAKDPP